MCTLYPVRISCLLSCSEGTLSLASSITCTGSLLRDLVHNTIELESHIVHTCIHINAYLTCSPMLSLKNHRNLQKKVCAAYVLRFTCIIALGINPTCSGVSAKDNTASFMRKSAHSYQLSLSGTKVSTTFTVMHCLHT